MSKIMSIDTQFEANFKKPIDTSDLTGLEAFAFGYDVQWPISLVLNRKSLACYQMLLRHLLYCKHVEKLLTNVWITTKVLKTDFSNNYLPSLALKQKMIHFLQNLEYYMTFEGTWPCPAYTSVNKQLSFLQKYKQPTKGFFKSVNKQFTCNIHYSCHLAKM